MAKTWTCDHCGVNENSSTTKNRRPADWLSVRVLWPAECAPEGVTYDLCVECAEGLKAFLGRD